MAKLITRTFISTEATLTGITMNDGTPTIATETIVINATFENNKVVQKWVDKHYDGKLIHPYVATVRNIEELRGITPESFYANSIKLDPVTRKPIDTTEDYEVEDDTDK